MSTIYLTNDSELSQVANAIREKGGTSNNLVYPDGFVSAINNIPTGGGGGSVDSGVVFIDYDGTIVESWEPSSVASKTSLPANPTHTGLVGEGWNWSLAEIQSYMTEHPTAIVVVGQIYQTSSGLTEIDISLTESTGLTVTCKMSGTKNWGDSTQDSLTSHTYTKYGDYTIMCNGTTIPSGTSSSGGLFASTSSNTNRNWCTAIRLGKKVTRIGSYAFLYCQSLKTVTISTKVKTIEGEAFQRCYSLVHCTLPAITTLGTNVYERCYRMRSFSFATNQTIIPERSFDSCYALNLFTLPDSITSLGSYAFGGCYALPDKITLPKNLSNIDSYALNLNYTVINYDFSASTAIPTLSNSNAFTGINNICKIVVPDALYTTWKSATNWATYADYIYKASEVA